MKTILIFILIAVTNLLQAQRIFSKEIINSIQPKEELILPIQFCMKDAHNKDDCPFCDCGVLLLLKDYIISNKCKVQIEVNTDFRGKSFMNLKYSRKVANSIKTYLISEGVDSDKISSNGLGEKNLYVFKMDTIIENINIKAGTKVNEKFIKKVPLNDVKEKFLMLDRRIIIKLIF